MVSTLIATTFTGRVLPPLPGRLGKVIFSPQGKVGRGKIDGTYPVEVSWCPAKTNSEISSQRNLVFGGFSNHLVALPSELLPSDILNWSDHAEIFSDLDKLCSFVVFCSYLQFEHQTFPYLYDGFVIEGTNNHQDFSPFSFDAVEQKQLAAGFIPSANTVFVNSALPKANNPALFRIFPPITFLLGYLKARVLLLANGQNPDQVSFNLKYAYARQYEYLAATKLAMQLQPGSNAATSILEIGWLPAVEAKTMASFARLSTLERYHYHLLFRADS